MPTYTPVIRLEIPRDIPEERHVVIAASIAEANARLASQTHSRRRDAEEAAARSLSASGAGACGRAEATTADAALTIRAINALSDGNQSAFARTVGLDGAGVRRRIAGTTALTELERRYYALILEHPREFRRWLR